MKKFILKIFVYLSIVTFVALVLEFVIYERVALPDRRYYVQGDWFDNKNRNSEVLLIGNSRTWVQIDPFKVSDSIQMSCEAIAVDGQAPRVVFCKLKNYLKQNRPPKLFLIQFDAHFLGAALNLYGDKNWNVGYFLNRLELCDLKKLHGYKYYYSFMPLWGIDLKTRVKILFNDTLGSDSLFDARRGYFSNTKHFEGEWNVKRVLDLPIKDRYFDSILHLALSINAKPILITGPYSPILNRNSAKFKKEICDLYNDLDVIYNKRLHWIYLNDTTIFSDSSFFYNHLHLNTKGSKIYSELIGNKLKILLNNNK